MADFTGIFRQPYDEQVAAFRLRLEDLIPTARWDDISRNAHDRAFMVAKRRGNACMTVISRAEATC